MRLNEDCDISSHISNILSLKDKLFAIGKEIVESHSSIAESRSIIAELLLCSSPYFFDPFVAALEERNVDDFILTFIKNKYPTNINTVAKIAKFKLSWLDV